MAVPKSKYIKSKYIKSKYIKSKYIKSKYLLTYMLIYKLILCPYNIKLNHVLSKLTINSTTYNSYRIIFFKRKLKNYYYKNINIMYLKKPHYYANYKYYYYTNKLRYLYNFI